MYDFNDIHSTDTWQDILKEMGNVSPYAWHEWGEYKSLYGWLPIRIAFFNRKQVIAGGQFLLKKKSGCLFGWCPGGFISGASLDFDRLAQSLLNTGFFQRSRSVIRINFVQPYQIRDKFQLIESPFFNKALAPVGGKFTVKIDLRQGCDRNLYPGKHKKNLKRALKSDLDFIADVTPVDFLKLHNEMCLQKGLHAIQLEPSEFHSLLDYLGRKSSIYGIMQKDQLVAACVIYDDDINAFYALAATNNEGRKSQASYLMVDRLLGHLAEKGNVRFDFGGVSPYDPSVKGVNDFKFGFGGDLYEHLGEWEIASSEIFRKVCNRAISKFGQ